MTDLTPPVAWPPGWYHDPDGAGLLRWWDGTAWTDRTVTSEELPATGSPVPGRAATAAPSATSPASAVSADRRPVGWGARLTLAATVGITLAALVVVLVHVVPGESRGGSTATLTTAQISSPPANGAAGSTAPQALASTSRSASTGASTSPAVRVPAGKRVTAHTFADGTFSVPRGVPPGTYHTINHVDDCEWYRSAVVGGVTTVVGQGIGDDGPAVATVLAGDVLFRSVDCGRWSSAPTGPAVPATQFDQGTFRVGVDIAPGRYSAAAPAGCVWRRLSAFTGTPGAVIAEGHPDDPTTVTISPTDLGFYTIHCGTWRRG